jgi:hypothetical protein
MTYNDFYEILWDFIISLKNSKLLDDEDEDDDDDDDDE